jgi:hypothetical protein
LTTAKIQRTGGWGALEASWKKAFFARRARQSMLGQAGSRKELVQRCPKQSWQQGAQHSKVGTRISIQIHPHPNAYQAPWALITPKHISSQKLVILQ